MKLTACALLFFVLFTLSFAVSMLAIERHRAGQPTLVVQQGRAA